ncbi:Vesicle transport protein, Got1/SFT2-like, partial [Dillenia turbinata]
NHYEVSDKFVLHWQRIIGLLFYGYVVDDIELYREQVMDLQRIEILYSKEDSFYNAFCSCVFSLSGGDEIEEFVMGWRFPSFSLVDTFPRKIGIGLTGFGIFFSFLGILFLFDKGLLAMGNILFLSGVTLTIGLKSTMQFFMKPQNYKVCILGGNNILWCWLLPGPNRMAYPWHDLGVIRVHYPLQDILCSGFWPTLAVFLQKIPILGWLFQQPFVRSLFDRYRGKRVPV